MTVVALVAGSNSNAKAATSVLTLGIAAFTAGFISLQLRAIRRGFSVQMFDATSSGMRALTEAMLANSDLRPFFYDAKPTVHAQDVDERSRLLALAELYLDFMDTELLRRSAFSEATDGLPPFEPWIRSMFSSSPVLREFLQEHGAWYSGDIAALAIGSRQ